MLANRHPDDFQTNHIDEALAYHDGDVRDTIRTLLEDVEFLRR